MFYCGFLLSGNLRRYISELPGPIAVILDQMVELHKLRPEIWVSPKKIGGQRKIENCRKTYCIKAHGNNLTKPVHVMCREAGLKIQGDIFVSLQAENCSSSKIIRDFRQRETLIANISTTDRPIKIGKSK